MITSNDVREYILDRSIADNAMDLGLTFSSAEISSAMTRCAREYNSIPPYCSSVVPEALPDGTNTFLDGIVVQLYISRLSKLQRSDIDYDAGGVKTNLVSKQIEHLTNMIKFFDDRFRSSATSMKIGINLSQAWGQVG